MKKRKTRARSRKSKPGAKKAAKRPHSRIEKLKAYLATQQESFQKQLKEVEKKNPLVALAFYMQEGTIAELCYPGRLERTMSYSLYEALTRRSIDVSPAILAYIKRRKQCEEQHDECMGEFGHRNPQTVLKCYLEFLECMGWNP